MKSRGQGTINALSHEKVCFFGGGGQLDQNLGQSCSWSVFELAQRCDPPLRSKWLHKVTHLHLYKITLSIVSLTNCSGDNLEEALKSLPSNATMRDIFDFCVRNNLHNLAQGNHFPHPLPLTLIPHPLPRNDRASTSSQTERTCSWYHYARWGRASVQK